MENRVITISREYGSGGRMIGRKLAEKLGIHCYDADLIQRIVDKSGYSADYVKEEGESAAGGVFSTFLADRTRGLTAQDNLWNVQCQVIAELADKESCVIVGRCADYILKDRDDVFSVFISAEPEARIKRITEIYGDTGQDPEKVIKDRDKRRSSYYQYYTELEWGKASNYGICLSSSGLGFEKCAEILYDLCK